MNDSSITTKNKMPIDTLLSAGGKRVRTNERSACKAGRSACLPHRPIISDRHINGGGERVRTDDLLRARQALSQLSYTPNKTYDRILTIEIYFSNSIVNHQSKMVGLDGVEPSTSRLSGVRSNRTELQAHNTRISRYP